MSRESTSLKKSSSDCLKLAKQWYSIWVKWCYFWTTAFSQVVQKHYLGAVGNNSIYWLLTLSVTHVPNIMKIRQCFLELRLKMSGMFFWDTLYIIIAYTYIPFYRRYFASGTIQINIELAVELSPIRVTIVSDSEACLPIILTEELNAGHGGIQVQLAAC